MVFELWGGWWCGIMVFFFISWEFMRGLTDIGIFC